MSNDNPTRSLSPEVIDELCSADIDGELDAACADLDIAPEDARAAIAAHSARRDALAAAGARVGEQTEADELDELERRRMTRTAIARTSRSSIARQRRMVLVVGAAAAVLVAAIAITVAAVSNNGGTARSSANGGAAFTPATVDIGAIKNGRDIALGLHIPTASTTPSPTGAKQIETSTTVKTGPGRCLPRLPLAKDANDMRIVATAQFHGKSVTIAQGTLDDGKTVLWAFQPSNCFAAITFTAA